MIELCCAKEVSEKYQGDAKIFMPANGSLPYDRARKELNFYTVRALSPLPPHGPWRPWMATARRTRVSAAVHLPKAIFWWVTLGRRRRST